MSAKNLVRRRADGQVFYQFKSLCVAPGTIHAITTRTGGVSRKPYESLNLAEHVDDRIEDVIENRRRIGRALGVEPERWVSAQQVHRTNVAVVDGAHRGEASRAGGSVIAETDALVMSRTDGEGLALATFSADCPLIIMVHREGRALALAHASRRTTVGGLVAKTVYILCESFGLRAEDLLAGIAPSIGPQCYRVGADVYDAARSADTRCDRFMRELDRPGPNEPRGWLFDLWQANRAQMVEAGVQQENIATADICNHCHTEEFFSYRAERPATGRYALIAGFR